MPPLPDPEELRPGRRPWWAGSAPSWKSPWSLEDDDEELPVPREGATRRVLDGKVDKAPVPGGVGGALEVDRSAGMESVREIPKPQVKGGMESTRVWQGLPGAEVSAAAVPKVESKPLIRGRVPVPTVAGAKVLVGDNLPIAREQRNQERSGGSWSSVILMALAILVMTFVAWLYMHDQEAPWDEDLQIASPVDLTPVTSAPQRLNACLNSVVPVQSSELTGKDPWQWDTMSLSKMMENNGQALDNLKDLLEDFEWHGRHASWHQADLGSHPNWTYLTILKQVEAAYLDRRGEELAAFSAVMDLAELSRRLMDLCAWPSFYFRSNEVHARCTKSMVELLRDTELTAEMLGEIQRDFALCEPTDRRVKEDVLPAFYVFEKKLLLGPLSGEPLDTMPNGVLRPKPARLFFKINETLDMMANTLRYLRDQVGGTSVATSGLRDIWSAVPGRRDVGYYEPNGAGMAYAAERLSSYLEVPSRHQLARTRHLLTVTLFAVRRFYADHQGLPKEVELLRPAYLSQLTLDPFSGAPFQLSCEKGLLYSVGTDFHDGGGRGDAPALSLDAEPTVPIGVRSSNPSP